MTVTTTTAVAEKKEETLKAKEVLDDRQTPWRSIWISIGMQFIAGIQISIYYMSMWPYLNGLDTTATMDFLGWVVASCSVGCSIANPIFGYWNQQTMSVKWPTACGFLISAIGQTMYGLLPMFSSDQKWMMIVARFITGFGSGSLAVLRAYVATAAVPKDQLSAISYGTAGWVLGISFGPVIQAVFTPLDNGFYIGKILINMYTLPAFFMVLILIASIAIMILVFREQYSGIIEKHELEPGVVIPKYDLLPALACVWLWVVSSMIATNIEVISTPISTAMYDWKDSKSILINGIIECASCIVSVSINLLIGYTRIGRFDKRKQCIFGLAVFLLFHIFTFPWPFYPGPLDPVPPGNTTAQIGGCEYSWCAHTVRIPLGIYVFCFVVLYGIAFPFVGSPSASLYSDILGPRKQGMMQGLYSFGGSVAQFVAPIFATYLFQHSGYKYVIVTQIVTITMGLLLVAAFYRRLVPLKLRPSVGKSAKYDEGIFYVM